MLPTVIFEKKISKLQIRISSYSVKRELFTKMTFKIFKGFLYLRKSAKGEMPFSRPRRHKILSNFCRYSKRSYGKKVERMKFIFGRYAGHPIYYTET